MKTDDPNSEDFYWTIEMRTEAPSVHDVGAREHTAELVLFHENRGRIKSVGRAHFVVVPFGYSAASFLDCADEVSSTTLASAAFAASTVEIAGGAGMVYISSVELDENIRGQNLGLFLVTNAVRALTDLAPEAVAVLEPSPFYADELDTATRRKAVEKLSSHWTVAGFEFGESDTDSEFMSVLAGEIKTTDPFPPVPPSILDTLR
ncbi:hypothetical protein ACR9WD_16595 (plasmid) [Glutamicibacter sp. PAEs-4]|uniref:hypothetical protein n=1 Tax=Glutamicibacter sp. PAEs-4 TaxID=3444114 RepID=UPI003EB76B9F